MVIGRAIEAARRLGVGLRADLVAFGMALDAHAPRPGLYAYRLRPPGGRRTVHLRVHPDGSALLLVDASRTVHLNRTAAWLARLALAEVPRGRAETLLRRRFPPAESGSMADDCRRVYELVEQLAGSGEDCVACRNKWLSPRDPFSSPSAAPYKADLALTYACNNACGHCYNPPQRRRLPALSLRQGREVLRRLRAIGVMQVIFTGGEPTLHPALVKLVRSATRLGLVAGLNTNGRPLADPAFVAALAHAGLAHVQITLESSRPEVHNAMTGADSFAETVAGIRRALEAGLHTITNTTLTRANADHAPAIIDFLHSLGLRRFATNGMIHAGCGRRHPDSIDAAQLAPILLALRGRAAELGMRMLWYTPTDYCRLSPLELELGPRRCNAGEYSICIEPNGDVLPCQSYYVAAGNLLGDPWPQIWNSPLFARFRRRTADPKGSGLAQQCWDCAELPVCGGGCPLEREACADLAPEGALLC